MDCFLYRTCCFDVTCAALARFGGDDWYIGHHVNDCLFPRLKASIRRHVRMAEFASRCGLEYNPVGKTDTIGLGLLFDVGYSRRYRGVLSYGRDGQRLPEVGRYEYTVGSGKQRRTYTWYYAGMRLPRRVPHLVLDSKSNDGIVMGKALISNLPVVFRTVSASVWKVILIRISHYTRQSSMTLMCATC